ncbi:GNAT family N-acetyltransferase [Tardiphaga sp. vice304]|uniref:GNAT family N-acetyltransferase n=1 Tax=Tardiphaga sp. vice304 TaxID=2592817 RepID=UPI00116562A3|nr:N-acetyltransferase [Tardiphaga sp. vice304]QDM27459.1 GNAT family N-acetyltransferase [Tardiphaga sp. vice304]
MSAGRTAALAGQLRLAHPGSRIRTHAAADDEFCRSLFREERAAQFSPLDLGDGALRAMLDQQFEAQRMATTRRFPDAEAFIIAHAGRDVGRLIVTFRAGSPAASEGTASRPSDSPTLHLIDLALAPAARNCGIGSDVINSLARAGHALGAKHFTLSVLQSNEAARRLYGRLGFSTAADGVYSAMVRHLE